jgi:hypothetical protein
VFGFGERRWQGEEGETKPPHPLSSAQSYRVEKETRLIGEGDVGGLVMISNRT